MATPFGRWGTEAEGSDLFRITQQSIPEAELGAGFKPPKSQSNEQAPRSHLSSKTRKAIFAQILTQSVCSGQKLLLVIDSL